MMAVNEIPFFSLFFFIFFFDEQAVTGKILRQFKYFQQLIKNSNDSGWKTNISVVKQICISFWLIKPCVQDANSTDFILFSFS